jgi:hypothetical protein
MFNIVYIYYIIRVSKSIHILIPPHTSIVLCYYMSVFFGGFFCFFHKYTHTPYPHHVVGWIVPVEAANCSEDDKWQDRAAVVQEGLEGAFTRGVYMCFSLFVLFVCFIDR